MKHWHQSPKSYSPNKFQNKNLLGNQTFIEKLKVDQLLKGHTGCVNSVLFSEHGDFIYTGSDDTRVNIYRTEGGSMIDCLSTIHTNNIFFAKDLPYSSRELLVTCAADGRVALTNMTSRNTRMLFRHKGRAHRISLVPNTANQLYTCGEDGLCCLFDIRDGARSIFENPDVSATTTPVAKTQFRNNNKERCSIYTVGVNPNRPWEVALGGEGSHVCMYDNRKIERPFGHLCPWHLSGPGAHVTGLKYSHSGEALIASYSAGDIYSFALEEHVTAERRPTATSSSSSSSVVEISSSAGADAANPEPPSSYAQRYAGHRNRDTVKQVSFVGNRSEFVVSGSDCGHIFLWSSASAEVVAVLKGDSRGAVNCFGTHPEVPYMCSSGLDSDAKLWSPTGEHTPLTEGSAAKEAALRAIGRNSGPEAEDDEDDDEEGGLYSRTRLRALLQMLLREEAQEEPEEEVEVEESASGPLARPSRRGRMIRLLSGILGGHDFSDDSDEDSGSSSSGDSGGASGDLEEDDDSDDEEEDDDEEEVGESEGDDGSSLGDSGASSTSVVECTGGGGESNSSTSNCDNGDDDDSNDVVSEGGPRELEACTDGSGAYGIRVGDMPQFPASGAVSCAEESSSSSSGDGAAGSGRGGKGGQGAKRKRSPTSGGGGRS